MNVPAIWEGEYRLKEEGDVAKFYYLKSDGSSMEIFEIKKEEGQSATVLCSDNYSLNIEKKEILETDEKLGEMMLYFDLLVDSLKCS